MPQPKKGAALGSNPKHQALMLRNLARSLFQHERIKTTEAKAKLLRPYAEKLITKAKKGGVHHRRLVLSEVEDRSVVHKLFSDIGPRFSSRNGGYTRILKIGPRNGDAAPMALIELVDSSTVAPSGDDTEDAGARRRRLRRPSRRRGSDETPDTVASSAEEDAPALEDEELEAETAEASGDDVGAVPSSELEDTDAADDDAGEEK